MATDPKYGRITSKLKKFPKNEPVFLLRGQDKLAAKAVRYYAKLRRKNGDYAAADDCEVAAASMEAWTPRKMPD